MTALRWSYRVMFGIAWTAGAVTGVVRFFGDLSLEQVAIGYSLSTTAFMAGASAYMVAYVWSRHG